jgi:hypothetical protein
MLIAAAVQSRSGQILVNVIRHIQEYYASVQTSGISRVGTGDLVEKPFKADKNISQGHSPQVLPNVAATRLEVCRHVQYIFIMNRKQNRTFKMKGDALQPGTSETDALVAAELTKRTAQSFVKGTYC